MVKGVKMEFGELEALNMLFILVMNVTYFRLTENREFEVGI